MKKGLEGSLGKLHGRGGVWVGLADWEGFRSHKEDSVWAAENVSSEARRSECSGRFTETSGLISLAEELGLCRDVKGE